MKRQWWFCFISFRFTMFLFVYFQMDHFLRSCKSIFQIWQMKNCTSSQRRLLNIFSCSRQEQRKCRSPGLILHLPFISYMTSLKQCQVHQHVQTRYICMLMRQRFTSPYTDISSQHWWMEGSLVRFECQCPQMYQWN